MAESLASNCTRDLWREIQKMKPQSKVTPPHIDGHTDSSDIADMFRDKYQILFNSVPSDTSHVYDFLNEAVRRDDAGDYDITTGIIDKAISRLKSEKNDGDKGLWLNLVIHSTPEWRYLLSYVISSMFIHGHYPDELLLSTISSLPKDRYGDVCDSRKYRGISLSSCITKIIDLVILLKYPHCFRTSELQFAYKKHHATPMCTLALKEVVKYYTSRRGSVYCCLLDATKAFDRVKFDKLFEIMIARNIPSCAIRLVFDMYNRQKVRTVWNGQYSSSFSTSNGVRQGGVLSPILFTLYIDVLLERLESSGVGCHIGHEYLGSLCSADDLALLAPTVFSLRRMLKICEEFSVEYDIIFNAKNTVCILFSGRHGSRTPPVMSLNGTVLHWKDTVKHLGNFISNDLSEDEEIRYSVTLSAESIVSVQISNRPTRCRVQNIHSPVLPPTCIWVSGLDSERQGHPSIQHHMEKSHPKTVGIAQYGTLSIIASVCVFKTLRWANISTHCQNVQWNI